MTMAVFCPVFSAIDRRLDGFVQTSLKRWDGRDGVDFHMFASLGFPAGSSRKPGPKELYRSEQSPFRQKTSYHRR